MLKLVTLLLCAVALQACAVARDGAFHFPDGSPDRGREVFDTVGCRGCHRIARVDPPFQGTGAASVNLGDQSVRVKTYGDLVTSIINPSHKLVRGYAADEISTPEGESLMSLANLNEVLTVQQLIDLVAFLQVVYEVVPPPSRLYRQVYPPEFLGMPMDRGLTP
jgi:hypothetical protein